MPGRPDDKVSARSTPTFACESRLRTTTDGRPGPSARIRSLTVRTPSDARGAVPPSSAPLPRFPGDPPVASHPPPPPQSRFRIDLVRLYPPAGSRTRTSAALRREGLVSTVPGYGWAVGSPPETAGILRLCETPRALHAIAAVRLPTGMAAGTVGDLTATGHDSLAVSSTGANVLPAATVRASSGAAAARPPFAAPSRRLRTATPGGRPCSAPPRLLT
ncbi:DUF742 domain-containing protein [Kitasatospora camelliae]|uniref:DUF742 domain-containing protein n=1 Tax=Kitasatospora camelliae TaxID=3156397 RepID=A0AAU8K458_9ACTN